MKAHLKGIYSTDIPDLSKYVPENNDEFGFPLRLMVGPNTEDGFESFDIMLCTPQWLADQNGQHEVIIGRHYLIVFEYNYERIINRINKFLLQCTGDTWQEVAEKVARLGRWEFEDYVDSTES